VSGPFLSSKRQTAPAVSPISARQDAGVAVAMGTDLLRDWLLRDAERFAGALGFPRGAREGGVFDM